MEEAPIRRKFTENEYLLIERQAEFKSEFFEGEIFYMSGAGPNHNIISANVSGLLYPILKRQSCRGFYSDMRLHIPQNTLYTYPDYFVTCGKLEFSPGIEADNLVNPILIVEILSPSTKAYDKGKKFKLYQAIPTLRQYILIDSTRPFEAESFLRSESNTWVSTQLSGAEARIYFEPIDHSLSLDEIYEETVF